MKTFTSEDYKMMMRATLVDEMQPMGFSAAQLTNAFLGMASLIEQSGWLTEAQADYLVNRTAMETAILNSLLIAMQAKAPADVLDKMVEEHQERVAIYDADTAGGTILFDEPQTQPAPLLLSDLSENMDVAGYNHLVDDVDHSQDFGMIQAAEGNTSDLGEEEWTGRKPGADPFFPEVEPGVIDPADVAAIRGTA